MISMINLCRACHNKGMARDFDRGVYVCQGCGAEYKIVFGEWHGKWSDRGTEVPWRPEFLGEQIKAGKDEQSP